MSNFIFLSLALLAGIMIVIQGGTNAQLGTLLKSPLLASLAALSVGTVSISIAVIGSRQAIPTLHQFKEIPLYLWWVGGLLSSSAITLFYYIIPKIGISSAITFSLVGQLLFAAIAAHYGWFNSTTEPLTTRKIGGLAFMITGIFLLKTQS